MFFIEGRIKKILEELHRRTMEYSLPIHGIKWKECEYGELNLLEEKDSDWETYSDRLTWGGRDKHSWFRFHVILPEEFIGSPVIIKIKTDREGWDATNPQFIAWVDKKLQHGLDVNHTWILLPQDSQGRGEFCVDLYAYGGTEEGYSRLLVEMFVLNRRVEKLYYDISVPLEAVCLLPEEDKRRIDTLAYLEQAINLLDLREDGSEAFYCSVEDAISYLEKEFYHSELIGNENITELCVGHTHIDVAWLWSLRQTREKAVRSFSTVISLMKEFPEYIFMSSQPQLYQFVKQDQPELYEEIKDMVAKGRWEPEGSMWVEADCNLISGESLVRQIMFGKSFFKEEFGVENKILWLPDVFGYSAALPQVMKKSGIEYFMTTKISWNEFNKLPYDTFLWRGIDGTEVLTQFITTQEYHGEKSINGTTYNGIINPSHVLGCWQRYQQKNINNEVLNCFGFGDGGGGPTREMLEHARRMEKGLPGLPKVQIGKSIDFFQKLENNTLTNPKLPKWVGELYLEFHRGTYTSMARNKKYNRKAEFMNQDLEWLSVMAEQLTGLEYPAKKIHDSWEVTLLNQFHDIIPGSSIKEVYETSKEQYEQLLQEGKELIHRSLLSMVESMDIKEHSFVIFNQLGFMRDDIVTVDMPEGWKNAEVYDCAKLLPAQVSYDGKLVFYARKLPAKGYKKFIIKEAPAQENIFDVVYPKGCRMENGFFELEFNKEGNITSLYDKQNKRQVLKPNAFGNVLQVFEDKPMDFDAWNLDIFYQEKSWEMNDVTEIRLLEEGPVRKIIQIKKNYLKSTLIQTISIYSEINRIDFNTKIDWKEKQAFVKAAFPVEINSDKATYDIQFGNVERPTHWNTSWDLAKFEVCAHKWADLSEGGYGVALLNDCKYGYDIKDSVMRLSLLKSAIHPNPDADKEVHEFTYSLYPHAGNFKEAKVDQMAYRLNCPVYCVLQEPHTGTLPEELSFVSVEQSNVFIDTIKKAESGNEYIVRMYENHNQLTKGCCRFNQSINSVFECDLLENNISEVPHQGNEFPFSIKPFEIKTYKIIFEINNL